MKRLLAVILMVSLLLAACGRPQEMIGEEKAIEIALQTAMEYKEDVPLSRDIAVCEIVMIHDDPYYEVSFDVVTPDTGEHWVSFAVDIDVYTGEVYEVMSCC